VRIVVLSERNATSHSSWANNFELEDILVRTCGATLLAPRQFLAHTRLEPISARIRRGRYKPVPDHQVGEGSLLLLVGMGPSSLKMLKATPRWRRRFDKVAAFIVDLYPPSLARLDRRLAGHLDAIFVSYGQMRNAVEASTGVPTHVVLQAADTTRAGPFTTDRRIDVVAFGRQPNNVKDVLTEHFGDPQSPHLAWWSSGKGPHTQSLTQDRRAFWSLLRRTRLSLAYRYEDSHPESFSGVSPITARWFESFAAGCAVIGSKPSSPEASAHLEWPNSVLPLDTDSGEALEQILALLQDPSLLESVGYTNRQQAVLNHDWRHRISEMLDFLDLSPIPSLEHEIMQLTTRG